MTRPAFAASSALLPALLASVTLWGCSANDGAPPSDGDGAGGKADQISGADDPSGLLATAERRLGKLVTEAEVGMSFGVDDDKIPYPDTYWPMVDNGIAAKWLEKSGGECGSINECTDPQPSPLEKLVALTQPGHEVEAVAWEVAHHGKDVPNVADWFGHCPGWVAAATLNPPVAGPLWVRKGTAGIERCADGDAACTKLEIGDVNAIAAEAHEGAVSRFIGSRCDTAPADIKRDEFGRIVRDGRGCKGLNAGAMLIVMGNLLKLEQRPFGIDAQNESNTDQIWNQPAYRFTVNQVEPLTKREAANLVASGGASRTGDHDAYIWNEDAVGFALVDVTLHWVSETFGPNLRVVSGAETARETRMVAVIELDRFPSNSAAAIIGGEYLDDERVGANRLRVAPFAWLAVDAGPDGSHNPFVRKADAKQLLELAAGETGGGETETCEHDVCSTGGALTAGCDSCATTVCAADSFCCETEWDATCAGEARDMCAGACP